MKPDTALPRKLAVLDDAGAHLFWADEDQARKLLRDQKVELLRTKKGRVLGLRAIGLPTLVKSKPPNLVGKRYSHNRETEQNPRGCWELIRISGTHRRLLKTAIDQCTKVA
jgi:hypothetical protein